MEQKVRGLLAYLFGWVGGLIILLAFQDNNSQTKFNACQSIVSSGLFMLVAIILGWVPVIGWVISFVAYILMAVIAIIGMFRAYNETDFEAPVIGEMTKNIFKSILSK